ncbi:hypothetical protein VTG60DRAFT_3502 [Thermothelomyces hinnuleus]
MGTQDPALRIRSQEDLDALVETRSPETGVFEYITFYAFTDGDTALFGQLFKTGEEATLQDINREACEGDDRFFIKRPNMAMYELFSASPQDRKHNNNNNNSSSSSSSSSNSEGCGLLAQLLLSEALTMQRLSRHPHPHIVRYHGVRVRGGRVTGLVMDRHRRSLLEHMRQESDGGGGGGCGGRRGWRLDPAAFLRALASAVAHLHALGLAHNDINPGERHGGARWIPRSSSTSPPAAPLAAASCPSAPRAGSTASPPTRGPSTTSSPSTGSASDLYNYRGINDGRLCSSPEPYDIDDEILSPTAHYNPGRRLGDHQQEQYRLPTSRALPDHTRPSSPVHEASHADSRSSETAGSPRSGWELIPYYDPNATNRASSPDAASDSTLVIQLPRLSVESDSPPTAHRQRRERRFRTRSPSYTDFSRSRSRAFDTRRRDSNDTLSSSPRRYSAASRSPDPPPRNSVSYRPARYSQAASAAGRSSRWSTRSRDGHARSNDNNNSSNEELRPIDTSAGTTTYIYYPRGSTVHVDGPVESEYYEPPSPEYPRGRHIINLASRRRRR